MGIATSIACAIHCALLPVLLTSLPVFGVNIIHNSFFEWSMIILALTVGCYSLFHGYITHHRSLIPILIFSVGFIFLVLKQFIFRYEYLLLAIAILLVIIAHYNNYKLCHRSQCSSPHHKH